jgi:pimeloyl-ACP methyl ester carboxylesterase
MREHFTDIGGCRINWIEDGAGDPPFILIHGWGSSVVKWLDVLPALGMQRRAIALDLPGFGRSEIVHGSYSPGWMAGAVRAFMDSAGIERATLVGNSLGGLVAMYLAAAWPERVESMVLAAPALPNDGPPPSGTVLASLLLPMIPVAGEFAYGRYVQMRGPEQLVEEGLRRNFVDPARVTPRTKRALIAEAERRREEPRHVRPVVLANRQMLWALSARRERTWQVARAIKVPTMLVWGDGDRLVPPHVGERAVKEIPGAELVVMDDCGHNPQCEKPEEFASLVLTFMRHIGHAR